jgi:hypothetical protein
MKSCLFNSRKRATPVDLAYQQLVLAATTINDVKLIFRIVFQWFLLKVVVLILPSR